MKNLILLIITCLLACNKPEVTLKKTIYKGNFTVNNKTYSGQVKIEDNNFTITDSLTSDYLVIKNVNLSSTGAYSIKEYTTSGSKDLTLQVTINEDNIVYSSSYGGTITKIGQYTFNFSCPLEVTWGTGSSSSITGSIYN